MAKRKLVLIDGSSVAYRAFYALGREIDRFVNHNGLHTNAIYSFKLMFETILKNENPTEVLVAFDASKTTFRHQYFKDYKAGRAKTPGEFREQLPYIKELIEAFGAKYYELVDYEADDIIGTLAKQAEQEEMEVVIYSGDRDLTQLTTDHTTVKVTIKGVKELEVYTPAYVKEKYGLVPKQIIDMKGLAGDSSDNIPGVTKVGEKTAIKLLTQYASVEGVYEHIDEMKQSKMKEHLICDKEQAFLSKQLATIDTQAPVEISIADLVYQGPQVEKLTALYKELDFNQFLSQLSGETPTEDVNDCEYEVITSFEQVVFEPDMALVVELLDDQYHQSEIIGVAFGNAKHCYVLEHVDLIHDPVFVDFIKNNQSIVCDVKKTWVVCQRYGLDLSTDCEDVLIESYLLNTLNSNCDLHELAMMVGINSVQADEEVYGKGAKRTIPEEAILHQHLANKVATLVAVHPRLEKQLKEKEQWHLYKEVEQPLSYILGAMEHQGVSVNASTLKEIGARLEEKIQILKDKIFATAGETFNLNSPKQLGVILFEKMELPVIKKTKTGYSTSMDVLEKLRPQAPIVDDILTYRQLSKLQSTYITGLLKQIYPDGKIHTRYMQTLTQTGRLSSVDPNLQNIPVRLEEGRNIRKAFVPEKEDWVMFSSDYSQIELRVLADVSGDEHLIQDFVDGKDIHESTARRIFHLSKDDEVTSEMRRQAKAVNFGVVYGISDYGLSENLNISRQEAKDFIDSYLNHYPGVKKYMDDIVEQAKEKGYVETLFKRRRYLPDIKARNFNVRSFAERTAINSPIQGSAADILKIAMVKMEKALKDHPLRAHLLMQVHDEVIFEVHQEDVDKLQSLVEKTMEEAVSLSVPLVTDSAVGQSWFEAK